MFKINRKLKFQTEHKRFRKIRINKENNDISPSDSHAREGSTKVKSDKPWKSIEVEGISDNFYLNVLDCYDASNIAIGTKTGVSLFDTDENERFRYDSASEIFCVKLM
jgi:hypothetical protein